MANNTPQTGTHDVDALTIERAELTDVIAELEHSGSDDHVTRAKINRARRRIDEIDRTITNVTRDWTDVNHGLFVERAELLDKLGELTRIENPDKKTQIAIDRLRRRIDDVTRTIVDANYGLVTTYVRRFTRTASPEDRQDFEGAGLLGLMKAISSYDPDMGPFGQWAYKPIQREVLRAVHLSDHSNMNLGDFERRPDVLRAVQTLRDAGIEAPDIDEIAAEADVTVAQARRVIQAPQIDSLSTPLGDEDGATLGEVIPDSDAPVDDQVLSKIDMHTLESLGLSNLDPRELFVLTRRLGLDAEPPQRLSTLGEYLGLSREAVRQIQLRAISKLSHPNVLRALIRNGR